MQRLEPKPAAGRLLILDRSGIILHYRPEGPGDRLGPLEKQILSILLEGPLHGAEISRRLGVWHNNVHVALKKLAKKELLKSWMTFGENLARTKVLRRFYSLNPATVSIAVPVKAQMQAEVQSANERVQTQALEREREGIRRQREFSPKPMTRAKAMQITGDVG